MQQRNLSVKISLIFWVLYFAYEWFGMAALSGNYRDYFLNACVAFPVAFVCSYITVNVLLKNYYGIWPKWKFWTVQILVMIGCLLAKRCLNYFFIYPRFFPHALGLPFFSFGKLIVEWVNVYLVVGVYALFYFVRNLNDQRQRVRQLEQEKTTAELALLKSQVQPHFIFNTLNNIYSAAVRTSPETAELVSHLSSYLNYSLYEAKREFVPLDSELIYIRSYLRLQRNRFGSRLDVSVNVFDNPGGFLIAPMLLLPLVENCFKHGIAESVQSGWVRIDISGQNDTLRIKIENSKDQDIVGSRAEGGGLGLENVRRRLELLYPARHEFAVFSEPDSFLVTLKIVAAR